MLNPDKPASTRRFFLLAGLGAIGAAVAMAAGWPLWRFLSPPAAEGEAEQVVVPRSKVTPGTAHFFRFRGQPAVAVQPSQGSFLAFSAVCTHLGCIVQWREKEKEFLCPCHAGRFAPDGHVISGPPPRPLDALKVTVADDRLLIG